MRGLLAKERFIPVSKAGATNLVLRQWYDGVGVGSVGKAQGATGTQQAPAAVVGPNAFEVPIRDGVRHGELTVDSVPR